MLVINNDNYNKYLTSCTVSCAVRGETIINTLAGTQYPYGTGIGYEAAVVLALVPTDRMQALMDAISGAGTTFTALFSGASAQPRTCRASNITSALQNVVDGGYWTVSFTIITVD